MKIMDNRNFRALEQSSFWIVNSMSGQEPADLLEGNEINKDQCRLAALIDEALLIYETREKEQEKLFFIIYCIVVLCILFAAVL